MLSSHSKPQMDRQLHWTQRIALVRHNLHGASCTGDFSFFKTLQAHAIIDGTDHIATLSALLDGGADELLRVLDNLNTGIAYVHEDAFRNVYEELRKSIEDFQNPQADGNDKIRSIGSPGETPNDSKRASLRSTSSLTSLVEKYDFNYHSLTTQQRQLADSAIDKMMSSAIMLIKQQESPAAQEVAASILILGTTFIADAMEVSLAQLAKLESCADDLPHAEACWAQVQNTVAGAVSALKGILNMLDANEDPIEELIREKTHSCSRAKSISSSESSGAWGSALRRMSSVFTGPITENSPTQSHKASIASSAPQESPPPLHVPFVQPIDCRSALVTETPKTISPTTQKFSRKSAAAGENGHGLPPGGKRSAGAMHSHAGRRPLSLGRAKIGGTVLGPIPPTPAAVQMADYEFFGPKNEGAGGSEDVASTQGGNNSEHGSAAAAIKEGEKEDASNTLAFTANAELRHQSVPPVPENTPASSVELTRRQEEHHDAPVSGRLDSLAEMSQEAVEPPKVLQMQEGERGGQYDDGASPADPNWPLHRRRWSSASLRHLPGAFETVSMA